MVASYRTTSQKPLLIRNSTNCWIKSMETSDIPVTPSLWMSIMWLVLAISATSFVAIWTNNPPACMWSLTIWNHSTKCNSSMISHKSNELALTITSFRFMAFAKPPIGCTFFLKTCHRHWRSVCWTHDFRQTWIRNASPPFRSVQCCKYYAIWPMLWNICRCMRWVG